MAKPTTLLCALLACAACHGDKTGTAPSSPSSGSPSSSSSPSSPAPRTSSVPLDPHAPLRVEWLGTQVRSARTWTSAIVPNARGGWNFITQSAELGSEQMPEWVVVDLEAGTYRVTDATWKDPAVSKYSVHTQLRAPNGRVFFPLGGTAFAYYDPTDESVHEMPPVVSDTGPDKIIYSGEVAPDGMLYGGTQSNALPTIVQIDPQTLRSTVLGHVGRDRKFYSYAYQIAVDPPWIYATVGEMPWELAALNIKTGESRILATRAGDRPWISLEPRPEGVRAQLITGIHTPQVKSEWVWCIDGKTVPIDASGKPPFKARNLPTRDAPIPGAPEIDISSITPDTFGVGHVRWKPAGASDWKTTDFKVKHTMPIPIEALTALPDGTILGGTKDYHGFFRTDGASLAFFGGPSPSRTVFATLDGIVYMTGYPNGVLYAYDPNKPWTGTTPAKATAPGSNPQMVGNFTASMAKYATFLVAASNRLYFAGRLERDGEGAGVGYYEPSTKKFVGHHDNLAEWVPAGLAVLPQIHRVVLSERVRQGSHATRAELVVYDDELREIERLVVKPDLLETGVLFAVPGSSVVVGVVDHGLYRYDIAAKKLLDWRDLPSTLASVTMRPGDGTLWGVHGGELVRVDPQTLQMAPFGEAGTMPAGAHHLVWQGDDLYANVGADLVRIARVGLH